MTLDLAGHVLRIVASLDVVAFDVEEQDDGTAELRATLAPKTTDPPDEDEA